MTIEYYFQGNLDKRWEKELAKASGRVLVFSPYLTPDTALRVLDCINDRKSSEIYTRFDPQDFINGSSSLTTLKQLSSLNINIYKIQDLHAKLIIVPGNFASIGSQNLTYKGTLNKEASVVITEPIEVAKIEQYIQEWLVNRQLITDRMITNLEKVLYPFRKKFQEYKQQLKKELKEIHQKELERLERERLERERLERERLERERLERERLERERLERERLERERLEEEKKKKRIEKFKKSAAQIHKSNNYIFGQVKNISNKYSFVVNANARLTKWILSKEEVELVRFQRYLCINEWTNTIGWVRVASTRITYIENSLVQDESIILDELDYRLTFEFEGIYDDKAQGNKNLSITTNIYKKWATENSNPDGQLIIECWFSLQDIELVNLQAMQTQDNLSKPEKLVLNWIVDNQDYFKGEILKLLLSPFKYVNKLTGEQANAFFGEEGINYEIYLGKINNYYVLIAK
jgi:hypothetical protein